MDIKTAFNSISDKVEGALLAQGVKPFDAAAAAVYLHGLAGDIAAEQLGKASMLPSDLIECIHAALRY